VELLGRKVITRELFDEKEIAEVIDPDDCKRRYCLCRNPETAKRETQTRKNLLELTQKKLDEIAAPAWKKSSGQLAGKPAKKKKGLPAEKIGARVGRVLQR